MGISIINNLGLYAVFLILAAVPLAFAQDGASKIPTDGGTLDVALKMEPFPPQLLKPVTISLEFLEPNTENPKSHIDYRATIVKDGQDIHTTYKQHTHSGADSFSYAFLVEGQYDVTVTIQGIDFEPIPREDAVFPIVIGTGEKIMIDVGPITTKEAPTQIPDWIRNNAKWWSDGSIGDSDFVSGIQFLIKEGILQIPKTTTAQASSDSIPEWIKNNAGWWADGMISDDDFVNGIQYLVGAGIISVDESGLMILAYSIEGNLFPVYQFAYTPQSPDCPGEHLHASSGYSVDGVLVSFTDPTPGGCGLGEVASLDSSEVSMSEEQTLAWEKATGVKIPRDI